VRDARRLARNDDRLQHLVPEARPAAAPGEPLVDARDVAVAIGGTTLVRDVTVTLGRGEIVALLGRNGAGKTTLLRALAGLIPVEQGTITLHGVRTGYVPQDPNLMLSAPTVRAELHHTLQLLGCRDNGVVDHWLAALHLTEHAADHPRSLSGGERQRVAIAAVAVAAADVLLLDEPTRGMDAPSRVALEHAVREHAGAGGVVVLATHDIELAARVATRVIVLGDGDVVADGDAHHVLGGSLFAPQIARVVPGFLTVDELLAQVRADPATTATATDDRTVR
jgi:ABC-type multidrug transport system ATPase subunit